MFLSIPYCIIFPSLLKVFIIFLSFLRYQNCHFTAYIILLYNFFLHLERVVVFKTTCLIVGKVNGLYYLLSNNTFRNYYNFCLYCVNLFNCIIRNKIFVYRIFPSLSNLHGKSNSGFDY